MEQIPQKQPAKNLTWTLETAWGGKTEWVHWEDIEEALDRLGPHNDSFMILEQRQPETDDYWFIQSAVALQGPHAGQYVVGCGWSGPEGPALVEWYGDYDGAVERFRGVWEGRELDFTGFEDQSHLLAENQRKERLGILCRTVGELGTNCYFVMDQIEKCAAVIDPGGDAPHLIGEIRRLRGEGYRLQYILLTHGHYDHVGALPALVEAFPEAQVYMHRSDYLPELPAELFPVLSMTLDPKCPVKNVHFYSAFNDRDVPLEEAEDLPLGGLHIHPIWTPGHSRGSVTLRVSGGPLFCGDTLFQGSCGRTDFPGGNVGQMMASLRLFGMMSGDAQVFPGHMGFTTLEDERAHNPYLRQAMREKP